MGTDQYLPWTLWFLMNEVVLLDFNSLAFLTQVAIAMGVHSKVVALAG